MRIRNALICFGAIALLSISYGSPITPKPEGVVPIDNIPFQLGERLVFNLHYGMLDAGEAVFTVANQEQRVAGHNSYELNVSGRSYPFFDPFYKVRDNYKSFVDDKTMLPTLFVRDIHEGSYTKTENYIFVRPRNQLVSGKKTFTVEPGTHDIVSTFYYLRCIDFTKQKVGAAIHIHAFFDEAPMETGIRYMGKETIKTQLGRMKCYVFKPILVKGRIFKNQDDMVLYVSEDKNQIPVRVKSKVYLDYVMADITSYSGLKYPLDALVKEK